MMYISEKFSWNDLEKLYNHSHFILKVSKNKKYFSFENIYTKKIEVFKKTY